MKARLFVLFAIILLVAVSACDLSTDSGNPPDSVIFNLDSGDYPGEIVVRLTAPANQIPSDIYYTLDGTTPDLNSTPYNATTGITIPDYSQSPQVGRDVTVKAVLYYFDEPSDVTTKSYRVFHWTIFGEDGYHQHSYDEAVTWHTQGQFPASPYNLTAGYISNAGVYFVSEMRGKMWVSLQGGHAWFFMGANDPDLFIHDMAGDIAGFEIIVAGNDSSGHPYVKYLENIHEVNNIYNLTWNVALDADINGVLENDIHSIGTNGTGVYVVGTVSNELVRFTSANKDDTTQWIRTTINSGDTSNSFEFIEYLGTNDQNQKVWIAGGGRHLPLSGGAAPGIIYRSVDNGLTWNPDIVDAAQWFTDGATDGDGDVIVFGRDGQIRYSVNHGTSWNSMPLPGITETVSEVTYGELNGVGRYAIIVGGNKVYYSQGQSFMSFIQGSMTTSNSMFVLLYGY